MSAVVPDFRSAVMIVVEASWEGADGALQQAAARMEDKSAGGACIRLKVPVAVGSNIRIQWRFEQFSGVVKYCRPDEREFVAGIQRDKSAVMKPAPATESLSQGSIRGDEPSVAVTKKGVLQAKIPVASAPARPLGTQRPERPVSPYRAGEREVARPPREWPHFSTARSSAQNRRTSIHTPIRTPVRTPVRSSGLRPEREAGIERKPETMKRKWLDLTPWRKKEEGLSVSGEESTGGNGMSWTHKENAAAVAPETQETTGSMATPAAADEPQGFQIDMLAPEDVYMAAGIMRPRGQGVNKVMEMLRSEHIRNLPKEMQRAAVMMAMEVAGITAEQVEKDAKARQDALDSYEALQKKQADAEWTRKAEENARIEADMERVKAGYEARIARNLEGVTREQSIFSDWQDTKQKEVDSMAAAVELCAKPAVTPVKETVAPAPPLASAAAAGAGVGADIKPTRLG